MIDLPLFPLGTVLCPGVALPLHVFEPRYRRLTERCLERGEPFGVVLIRRGREVGGGEIALAGVGTMAEIRDVRRLPDGRFELLVVGSGRFAIHEVDMTSEPYLVARAARLDDDLGDPDRCARVADRALRRFVRYLQLLRPETGEVSPPIDVRIEVETTPPDPAQPGAPDRAGDLLIPDDPTTLSYLLSGIIQVDPLQRQVLLEAATTQERLEDLDRLLGRELVLLTRRLRPHIVDATPDPLRHN